MTIKEESKKPFFHRIREKVLEKWESLPETTQTFIGIVVIILLGAIACSPILVFSSIDFFASMPFIYKMLTFVFFSVLFFYSFFKWTFKNISVLSKTLKTYYGWEDGIAVLLLIYGIYSFLMHPTVSFFVEFRAELLGAGIATLLIGNASQAAQIREEKKRLILQMGSPDHGFAIEAVRQIRQQGWLKDGSLKGANLYRANLSEAELEGANLSKAKLSEANLSEATLWGANLGGASLGHANLNRAWLWDANLSGAILSGANLNGADLRGANLSGADLQLANLQLTNLSEVDFEWANLSGANLFDIVIIPSALFGESIRWKNASYTEGEKGTIFPDGFIPVDHGMKLIHENESYEEAVERVLHNKGR